ncbi:MAG: glycosyltransferase family 2 protein [Planctomycetes bacterium]|nr:glycosyltransferase family 2 protein [Planctomycetota bacterium]
MTADSYAPRPRLSVVVPCYDEEENVEALVGECFGVLRRLGASFEMIVVDDGSKDGTLRRLLELREGRPELRVVAMARNTGQSGALVAGFARARGELVATLDGDLQNDPAEIPRLIERLEHEGCDVVSGWRAKRRDSFLRRASTRVANGVRKWFLADGMNDSASSMKVYRREVLEHMPVFHGMHRFFPAIAKMRGFRVIEVPVNHRPRLKGQAKYGLWNRVFLATLDMFGVAWLRRRAVRIEAQEASSVGSRSPVR